MPKETPIRYTRIIEAIFTKFYQEGMDKVPFSRFEDTDEGIAIASERHYHLVNADNLSSEELLTYRTRPL